MVQLHQRFNVATMRFRQLYSFTHQHPLPLSQVHTKECTVHPPEKVREGDPNLFVRGILQVRNLHRFSNHGHQMVILGEEQALATEKGQRKSQHVLQLLLKASNKLETNPPPKKNPHKSSEVNCHFTHTHSTHCTKAEHGTHRQLMGLQNIIFTESEGRHQ